VVCLGCYAEGSNQPLAASHQEAREKRQAISRQRSGGKNKADPSTPWPTFARRERKKKSAIPVGMTNRRKVKSGPFCNPIRDENDAPHTRAFRPVFALSHAKSNHSRTSAAFARKSNYSRTYAKHRGGRFFLFPSLPSPPLLPLLPSRSSLATNSNHSRTIGNCCPTRRTRSNIYHHITYPCRRADIFIPTRDENL